MTRTSRALRFVIPPLLDACRLAIGATALIFAIEASALVAIATLITIALAVGVLSTQITAWLRASTPFSIVFDSLVDYLTVVVAPWALARTLVAGPRTLLQEVLLDLPLLAGAIRSARNALLPGGAPRPGVDAGVLAFVSVGAVFLRLPEVLTSQQLSVYLTPTIAVLSLLMVAPLRYPSVTVVPGLSLVLFLALAATPFVETGRLTIALGALGLLYCATGHLLAPDVSD